MKGLTYGLLAAMSVAGLSAPANAAVVFSDDFESGLGNFAIVTGDSPMTIGTDRNIVGASQSAKMDSSSDQMFHNLGTELSGTFTHTMFIYDPAGNPEDTYTSTRGYGTIQAYAGAGFAEGSLQQMLAAGLYNTTTQVGEVHNYDKYQGRVLYGENAGWFNLDAPGSPDRSIGWHRFDIERLADGTTLKFYVDGILSHTHLGAKNASMDSITMGFGASTTITDINFDGISVINTLVPEPTSLALFGLAGAALLGRRRRA